MTDLGTPADLAGDLKRALTLVEATATADAGGIVAALDEADQLDRLRTLAQALAVMVVRTGRLDVDPERLAAIRGDIPRLAQAEAGMVTPPIGSDDGGAAL